MPVIDILVGLRQMYTIVQGIPHYDRKCDCLNDTERPPESLEAGHEEEQYSNDGGEHADQDSPITGKKSYQHHTEQEGYNNAINGAIDSYDLCVHDNPVIACLIS